MKYFDFWDKYLPLPRIRSEISGIDEDEDLEQREDERQDEDDAASVDKVSEISILYRVIHIC